MIPIIIGIGLAAILYEAFSGEDDTKVKKPKQKKIFISFAKADSTYRDHLVNQAKTERTPFSFVDMSVKKPWPDKEWKDKCRAKIKRCNGVIVLLSNKTWHSSGARWEIKCAKEEGIPVVGMHIKKNNKFAIPPELNGCKIITWSWDNLHKVINSV